MIGALQAIRASRTPGMARIGSTLMKGLEGQMTTASSFGIGQGGDEFGVRFGGAGALELELGDHRFAAAMDEVFLEVEPAEVGQQAGADLVVGHRDDGGADAHAFAEIGGDGGEGFAGFQAAGALDVEGYVAVAQTEPGLAAELFQRLHEGPGFVVAAPAKLAVGHAGQRIGDCIDVGGDGQAEMLEIVAGVDDDQQVLGGHDARQAEGELRAPYPAG